MKTTKFVGTITGCLLFAMALPGTASAANLKAEYKLDYSLSSSQSGAPDLIAVTQSPGASASFITDTVFGQSKTVYATSGSLASPTSAYQAGLTLDTTNLVSSNNYSVEMVFSVTGGFDIYKRILQTGTNDNGLYIHPSGTLTTYDAGSYSGLPFSTNTYHHLIATVSSAGQTQVWLDGALSHTVSTNVLNITSPNQTLGFFLDEYIEYTNSRTALIRVWDAPLTNSEVSSLNANPLASVAPVPEPETYAMLLAGLGLMGAVTRRRKQQ
jgi:hypothetical protein